MDTEKLITIPIKMRAVVRKLKKLPAGWPVGTVGYDSPHVSLFVEFLIERLDGYETLWLSALISQTHLAISDLQRGYDGYKKQPLDEKWRPLGNKFVSASVLRLIADTAMEAVLPRKQFLLYKEFLRRIMDEVKKQFDAAICG